MNPDKIKLAFKQLTCRHKWHLIGLFQEVDEYRNVRYGIRRYHCSKCNKISHQDSRRDRLEARAGR